MKKNILIILGHPDKKSLCGALADEYEKGAASAGAEVRRINLGEIKFDPILWHGYKKIQKLEPDLVGAQEDIKWAEHLVFIYPAWWGNFPAIMKGFFDRAFVPGFGFKYEGAIPHGRLGGRTCRIIITMGGPAFFYRLTGRLAEKILKKSILFFCGIRRVKTAVFGSVEDMPKNRAEKILRRIFELGKNSG